MKIYISGTMLAQARLRPMADRLRQMGHDVVSSWLYEPPQPAHLHSHEWNVALADKDLAEIFAADCIVLDLDEESTTGGRYVEWGVACCPGSMRRRYIVGGRGKTGVFLEKAHRRFDTWEEALAYFAITHSPR